jgi:hypothetical protein
MSNQHEKHINEDQDTSDEETHGLRKKSLGSQAKQEQVTATASISASTVEDEDKIDIRLTVQQGSFLPITCLIECG